MALYRYFLLLFFVCLPVSGLSEVAEFNDRLAASTTIKALMTTQDELRAEYRRFSSKSPSPHLPLLTETLDTLVVQAVDLSASYDDWSRIAASVAEFEQAIRATVIRLEQKTNESEPALEKLYRSQRWHDLNYSLAVLDYQQAWIAFRLGALVADQQRAEHWFQAEKGFRVSAARLFFPDVAFGGWWGMANIAFSNQNYREASRRLNLLLDSLPADSQLKPAVTEMLAVTLARQGHQRSRELQTKVQALDKTSSANNLVLAEEAFFLLEQHRKTSVGAIQAGEKLRSVIFSGSQGDRLLSRLMSYKKEIVGQEIGVLTRLISAEYAFAHQNYSTVVLDFRAFVDDSGLDLPLDLSRYRYHFAVALYETDLFADAMAEVEALLVGQVNTPLINEASKLHFLAARKRVQSNQDKVTVDLLKKSARRFVDNNSADPDVGAGWLVLARYADSAAQQERYLAKAQSGKFSKEARVLQTQLAWSALLEAIYDQSNRQGALVTLAQSFLTAAKNYPDKKSLLFQAQRLEARSLLEKKPAPLLKEVEELDDKAIDNVTVQEVLFRTRLRLHGKIGMDSLLTHLKSVITHIDDVDWQKETLLRLVINLSEQNRCNELIAVSDVLRSLYTAQPEVHRQILFNQLQCHRQLQQYQQAYELAKHTVNQYNNSGQAWMGYAVSAAATNRPIEAERAFARIARSTPPGSGEWSNSMLARLNLPEAVLSLGKKCDIILQLNRFATNLTETQSSRIQSFRQSLDCKNLGS